MERTKVAHMITDLDIGGAEAMLLKALRNFKSDRYEHFVISLKPSGKIGRMMENENYKVYALGLSIYNIFPCFIKLLHILKKERPRILHNYLFHADLMGRIAGRLARVPIIISSLRSVDIGGRFRELLLAATDFCVDGVAAVSKKAADVHILKGTAKKEKLRVIYNGVEPKSNTPVDVLSARRSMGIGEDVFTLLTVGRLEEVKGHTFLFKALEKLKKNGHRFKLIVVGGGKREQKLKKESISRGLGEDVIFTGEKEDISVLLDISDAFVLPSLWEGMPNALLEAMAAGLPVIATRVGGVEEAVSDGETGLLVEPGDSGSLLEAIERLIKDPGLRARLSQNAKDNTAKNFGIEKTIAETEALYGELLGKHGKD